VLQRRHLFGMKSAPPWWDSALGATLAATLLTVAVAALPLALLYLLTEDDRGHEQWL
jgi:hypothetical protein